MTIREHARRAIDVSLRALAFAVFISLLVAAWHDVSKAWDCWSYHLPFAARLAGLMSEKEYAFSAANQPRFEGFPLAAELAQGLAWRATGRVESANLVAFAALPALAWGLRRLFAVPAHLTVVALVAIPLVQIHATAAYVDLAANASAALLVLLAWRAIGAPKPPSPRSLTAAAAFAAFTANAKFQLVPVVVAAAAVIALRSLRADRKRPIRALIVLAALPAVFATPLKNLALHGNPVWPIELAILGRAFPHVEGAYASSPPWLAHAPRQLRFLCSVLEIGLHPIASHHRWSLDQWTPPSDPAYRMGGFFGAYVAVNLGALALAAVRKRTRETKTALLFFGAFTLIVASMPQSHELRYYMVWMIVLVAMNLALWAREAPRACGAVAVTALAVVAWSTGGTYLYASGDSFAALVAQKVDPRAIAAVNEGERICVARQPWTFLWAPRFHPEKRYAVQEAEGPEECGELRSADALSP